jgi:hypothetical protein
LCSAAGCCEMWRVGHAEVADGGTAIDSDTDNLLIGWARAIVRNGPHASTAVRRITD